MNDSERLLLEWGVILVFTLGLYGTFLKIRDFYYRRGHPIPAGRIVRSRDDGEGGDTDKVIQELLGSVCIGLFQSGLQGADGGPPRCLGTQCSAFEHCLFLKMKAVAKIDTFSRSEIGRKVLAEWGKK